VKIGFEGVFPAVLLYYHPFVFQYCNEVCQPVSPKHDTDRGVGFPQFFRKLLVAVFIFECECRIERLKIVTRGTATSRREAEQAAAELALTAAKEALK